MIMSRSLRTIALYLIAAAALGAAYAAVPKTTNAQSAGSGAQLILTWQVLGGSAPLNYPGKVLPVQGSPMQASATILENGKFVDLSSQKIYWFLDSNALGGGIGAQTVNFTAPGNNEIMQLQVEIPDYENGILNTAYIQMVNPQIVIVAPYPNDTFSSSSISVRAIPYFVNESDLSKMVFSWSVNGNAVSTAENPQVLNINLQSPASAGYSVNAAVNVTESGNPYFSVGGQVTLFAAQSSGQ